MTPIERAARALAVNNGMDAEAWGRWESDVQAVLMAIREPNEAMLEAADRLPPKDGWWPDEPGQRNSETEIWQAMIDAALEER